MESLAQLSVSQCIVNVGLLDHFIRFFIRDLLTHTFLHVVLILCNVWGCPSLPCQRHCRSTLRSSSPRQTTRSRSCQPSQSAGFAPTAPRRCSALAGWSACLWETPSASCRALPGVVLIGSWVVARRTCCSWSSLAPLPCSTEDLLFVVFLWCVRATHGLPFRAPVYRGCPCWDPPGCSHIQGDVTTKRQPMCVCLCVLVHVVVSL